MSQKPDLNTELKETLVRLAGGEKAAAEVLAHSLAPGKAVAEGVRKKLGLAPDATVILCFADP